MSKVYMVGQDGSTKPFDRVACKSEDKELQSLLEGNLNLLPADQLGLDGEAQWLLIRREMTVPSPETGENTWFLDFLIADHKAVPTLVECKRFSNTQARREIVGQLLEYAANGRSYWKKEELLHCAAKSAGGEEALRRKVEQLSALSLEDYFETLSANLKSSKMRLIFFLENTSNELRSVVEFLSEQFTDLEIFLVEARQYERGGLRVVVPWVFGYTEEARVARQEEKAAAKSISAGERGEEAFWKAVATTALTSEQTERIRRFIDVGENTAGCDILWGQGPRFVLSKLGSERYLFALRRNGVLEWNFTIFQSQLSDGAGSAEYEEVLTAINELLGTTYKSDSSTRYPQLAPALWLPRVDGLQRLMERYS